MPKGKITKRAVDALKCPAGKDREFLWDSALAGFGIAAFSSGKKVYLVQYRQAGRSRRATIGEHGRLTPDEARVEAKKLLGAVETGADPIEDRRVAREARTFAAVADNFMRQHIASKRKRRTDDAYERALRLHILPAIGSKKILDVRRAHVERLHGQMEDTPYMANKVLAIISAVWNWAAHRGEVALANNPAKGIERFPENSRERFLTTDELVRLGAALTEGETIGLGYSIDETRPNAKHAPKAESRRVVLDPFAVAAMRLLILTGSFVKSFTRNGPRSILSEASYSLLTLRRAKNRFIFRGLRKPFLPTYGASKAIRMSSQERRWARHAQISRSRGPQSAALPALKACDCTIFGTALHHSVLAHRWVYRSLASCWGILRLLRRIATRIWMWTHSAVLSTR
jgi:integrase